MDRLMRTLLSAIAIVVSSAAHADWYLAAPVASYHSSSVACFPRSTGRPCNESNPGLGAGYRADNDMAIEGMVWRNSQARTSVLAGVAWMPEVWREGDMSVRVGPSVSGATGYGRFDQHNRETVRAITLIVALNAAIEYRRVGLRVSVAPVPNADDRITGVAVLGSITYRLD